VARIPGGPTYRAGASSGRSGGVPLLEDVRPTPLHAAERALIEARKRVPNPSGLPYGGQTDAETLGLALSGGGIRSATFCLGFLQALSAKRLLGTVDYLSTVSGGGYIGSFLGALFARPDLEGSSSRDRLATVMDILADSRSTAMKWVRENGRYLSPNGAGDIWAAAAAQLRNWCSVLLVTGLFWLTLFLPLNLLRAVLESVPWSGRLWPAGFRSRRGGSSGGGARRGCWSRSRLCRRCCSAGPPG